MDRHEEPLALDKTAWEILNATADDAENLEQIYRQVCFEIWPCEPNADTAAWAYRAAKGAPLLSEVADRVRDLVERGLLSPVTEEDGRPVENRHDFSYVWRAWFRMTPQGRAAWEASGALANQESPP